LKFQISNPNDQTNSNDQNSKTQTMVFVLKVIGLAQLRCFSRFLDIGICDLFVIWCLDFVILIARLKGRAVQH
jgi:hypothetical protein